MIEEHEPPRCETCGLEITTGLMAVFCPRGESCEFWPQDDDLSDFVKGLRRGNDDKG